MTPIEPENETAYWELLQQAVLALQGKGIFSRKGATGRVEPTLVEIKNHSDKRFEVRFLTEAKKLLGSVVLDKKKVVGVAGSRFKNSDVMECKAVIAACKFLLSDKGRGFYTETNTIRLTAMKNEVDWRISFFRVPFRPGSLFVVVEDQQFEVKRLIRGR